MGISFDNALGIYESALRIRGQRASLLSSNLANVDTPNYKAQDIDFQQALKNSMTKSGDSPPIKATQNGHMGFNSAEAAMAERFYRTPTQPAIDGNTVEEHVEHAEFMKNSLEFQASFTMLNSRFKGLTKAIKGE